MERRELEARRRAVLGEVLAHVERGAPLLVLEAPPGSGKTHVITRAVALAHHRGRRVAVATQTNAQADDVCRRLAAEFPRVPVHRFASASREAADLGGSVTWCDASRDLPHGACVVVGTTAKWALSTVDSAFDVVFVDEAWQMAWSDFMAMGARLAPRFVLVGDPGQIAPVVPVDAARWETAPRPPHRAAPRVILADRTLPTRHLALPVSTRLPHDTVALLRGFYDFEFHAWAGEGDRRLEVRGAAAGRSRGVDGAIDLLTTGSVAMLTLPIPDAGVPEDDTELAAEAVAVARRLLERRARAVTEDATATLRAEDIGITATHRVMNSRITEALGALAGAVRVDTPERWQGLERKVMIAVHPLSGVTAPSDFDLDTGRLCVMASRHRVGLVIVSRDHVGATLADYAPVADQPVGADDATGRGHAQHLAVWQRLEREGRVAHAGAARRDDTPRVRVQRASA